MKIGIIGSGISGLGAALILKDHFNVELFEADTRLGGHAHTVKLIDQNKHSIPMDTGFLVFNELTYPHLTAMLKYLNIKTVDSSMTLSIKNANGLEWAGTNLQTVFAHKKNIFNLSFLKMLKDILRFHNEASENLNLSIKNGWTLSQLIEYRGHSLEFQKWYLLPMTGAIWSMSYEKCLEFPAASFMRFCVNHRLLQVNDRPQWKTIHHGSIQYVQAIEKQIPKIHKSSPIEQISKKGSQLVLHTNGDEHLFDKVIIATSAPKIYDLLKYSFPDLAQNFKEVKTSSNEVILHADEKVMPSKRSIWSAWNVSAKENKNDSSPIALTYYLNQLQPLDTKDSYFITLNQSIESPFVKQKFIYEHPQFDKKTLELQKKISAIQGENDIYFAGAWTRFGFHEDGLLSAIKVAEKFNIAAPWSHLLPPGNLYPEGAE